MTEFNTAIQLTLVMLAGAVIGVLLYLCMFLAAFGYDRLKVQFHKLTRLFRPAPAVLDVELRRYVDGIVARRGTYREHHECQGCAEVMPCATPAKIGNVVSVSAPETFAAETLNDFHNQTVAAQNNEGEGQ